MYWAKLGKRIIALLVFFLIAAYEYNHLKTKGLFKKKRTKVCQHVGFKTLDELKNPSQKFNC